MTHTILLSSTDYTHSAIAEKPRTDWRDEPVLALVPTTRTNRRKSSAANFNESADVRLNMLEASRANGSPVAAKLLGVL